VEIEDVWGVGKVICVNFNEDPANMFNVLSRAGRKKKKVGEGERGVGQKGVLEGC
jgi:hypothetical protein